MCMITFMEGNIDHYGNWYPPYSTISTMLISSRIPHRSKVEQKPFQMGIEGFHCLFPLGTVRDKHTSLYCQFQEEAGIQNGTFIHSCNHHPYLYLFPPSPPFHGSIPAKITHSEGQL